MKCSNSNAESLDFMKSKGMAFNCEDCSKKLKQDRGENTPIKGISQTKGDSNIYMNSDLDTRAITTRFVELIKNQITTNDTLLTLSNRILELEKTLKEKYGIIQNLEIKINILEQNERASLVEISGVKNENNENVETIVNDIAGIGEVDISLFDIENVYRNLSNRNLEAPQTVVEFSSKKKKGKNSLGNGEKLNSKDQQYILPNENLTAYNRKLLWETRSKAKELLYRYIWTRNGRIFCKKDTNKIRIFRTNKV
ncbi:unnamed protein product [Macrosiphum euphorbiae]|uniref:FP protein C-terminal domain-containing protein n=1 Tax=Macrosiphum euphorbiae TaxID=13131 RepID=A0AAV0X7D7_9HEMI|nr:unnamed protein product [Macrosiphum euphorbiae]